MPGAATLALARGARRAAQRLQPVDLEPRLEFSPHTPTAKQGEFLDLIDLEALYGGAAAGGKSDALFMAALQYVHVPGYNALLIRRSFPDLDLPEALLDRAHMWLDRTPARWQDKRKRWTFPSGATLTFGFLSNSKDRGRYKSAAFQFIGVDELTEFEELDWRFLFSRLRRLEFANVPLRMRAATNPGGRGHQWVQSRWGIEGVPEVTQWVPSAGTITTDDGETISTGRRVFVPARLEDNPHIDRAKYIASLQETDPIMFAQLLAGDWTARAGGGMFHRRTFGLLGPEGYTPPGAAAPSDPDAWQVYSTEIFPRLTKVRYWDFAATEHIPGQNDPDWTVGTLYGRDPENGRLYVMDVNRFRAGPGMLEHRLQSQARDDGGGVTIWLEEEGGSQSKIATTHLARMALAGFVVMIDRVPASAGSKVDRAIPVAAAAGRGDITVIRGPWVSAWFDEIEAFPMVQHDDQVDSLSGAHNAITVGGAGGTTGGAVLRARRLRI